MSVVKIKNKMLLEQLQSKISLRTGKKPSQQDLLDLCIELGLDKIEEIEKRLFDIPILNEEKVNRILQDREKLLGTYYDNEASELSDDDKEIYLS